MTTPQLDSQTHENPWNKSIVPVSNHTFGAAKTRHKAGTENAGDDAAAQRIEGALRVPAVTQTGFIE